MNENIGDKAMLYVIDVFSMAAPVSSSSLVYFPGLKMVDADTFVHGLEKLLRQITPGTQFLITVTSEKTGESYRRVRI